MDRPVEVTVHVPTSLRTCPDVPRPGVTDATDDRAAADYLTRLHQVATTCHTKLGAVDDILSRHEAAGAVQP